MKINRVLPIFIITAAIISGCSDDKSKLSDDAIFFPEDTLYEKKSTKYEPCHNGVCTILRGAPLDKNEKMYGKENYVTVFPAPRIPKDGVRKVTPRDLYSNLNNKNPQIRSDALYAIDTILKDENRKDEHPQIQGMLDDYIKNMEKQNHDKTEYEIATEIYESHFSEEDNKLNRPNWKGLPNKAFADEELINNIEDAPYNSVNQEALSENAFASSGNDSSTPLSESEIPEFDFSDPELAAYTEKTELEIQMEKNESLMAQKIAEDMIIDKEIMSANSNMNGWSCTKNMCENRIELNKKDLPNLIRASKITLDDVSQSIGPRLEAICSLKCVAQADKNYEPDVVNYLAKYVRRRVPWIIPAENEKAPPIKAVRPDVQAALYVLMARDRMKNVGFDINLIGTDLRGADMSFANLYNTNLSFTNLAETDMSNAYGLLDWNKVYLATINDTTKIPQSIFAGYVVVKQPKIPLQPAGSYKITTDDWIYWHAVPVK